MRIKNLILLLFAGIFLLVGCSTTVESADKKATDFSLEDINNRTVRLSDYKNDVIILNFGARRAGPRYRIS